MSVNGIHNDLINQESKLGRGKLKREKLVTKRPPLIASTPHYNVPSIQEEESHPPEGGLTAQRNSEPNIKSPHRMIPDEDEGLSQRRWSENPSFIKFDIVGETYDARFPWLRDKATQCESLNSSDAIKATISEPKAVLGSAQVCDSTHVQEVCKCSRSKLPRPHSFEGASHTKPVRKQFKGRKSDPLLYSSKGYTSRPKPIILREEAVSVSDLENQEDELSENGEITRSFSSASITSLDEINLQWDEVQRRRSETQAKEGVDVLESPRLSPDYLHDISKLLGSPNSSDSLGSRKASRARCTGSFSSESSDSENETSPTLPREGGGRLGLRRLAVIDTKNCGDVSPSSTDTSPSNSCDEGDNSSLSNGMPRRKSSVDLSKDDYPGDLIVTDKNRKHLVRSQTVGDIYSSRNGSTSSLSEVGKRTSRQSFSILKRMKSKSKDKLLEDVLKSIRVSEFKDSHLMAYKNLHWSDLIANKEKETTPCDIDETERKRREAVWELFRSECVFLIDHLMVLKHCFMEPLKKLQVEGMVMNVEPQDLFGNLDEICYVTYTFCKEMISLLLRDMSATSFGETRTLINAFQMFSKLSKDGAVYHSYCLNYTNALEYMESIRKTEEFKEFEEWAERDPRCNRLKLRDLLVAPMQHCTKLPLLLSNIRKYTIDLTEKLRFTESIQTVERSLKQLEEKMRSMKHSERIQEINKQLVWPQISDLDPRAFIPECLKARLKSHPTDKILSSPNRILIHEGSLVLVENQKSLDVYVFLFDDMLLITRLKKSLRKKQSATDLLPKSVTPIPNDKTGYIVHRQPIAIDRVLLHDISTEDTLGTGLRNVFVVIHINRFQQVTNVLTFQSADNQAKEKWMNEIAETKMKYGTNPVRNTNTTPTSQIPEDSCLNQIGFSPNEEQSEPKATNPLPLSTLPRNSDVMFL